MPHVIVKLYPGRSEQEKTRLAQDVTKAVMSSLGFGEDAISVAVEEVEPEDWTETVYRRDIQEKADTIYKKPGHDPLR